MATKYQDITWLAGRVFIQRDFVEMVEEKGLDYIFERCPYGDLTEEQKATFKAAFHSSRLREIVKKWWAVYDEEREGGKIPKAYYWEM